MPCVWLNGGTTVSRHTLLPTGGTFVYCARDSTYDTTRIREGPVKIDSDLPFRFCFIRESYVTFSRVSFSCVTRMAGKIIVCGP